MTVPWPPTYYTSEKHLALEHARIFEKSWLCVARASQIAEPGSFVRVRAGREDLILVRKPDRQVRALVNLCRHRGAALCTEQQGRFKNSIRCPYHGWSFNLDGHLTSAPFLHDLPPETKERHLFTAQVTEWLGYLWVNLDPSAPPLMDQIGPLLQHRFGNADVPSRYGCEELEVAKEITYDVAANWKILYENFCECYHCPTMHPEICQILPSWRTGYGTVSGPEGPKLEGSLLADDATGFSLSGKAAAPTLPGVPPEDARTFHGILLWPNVHLMFIPDHVMCMRFEPIAPHRTRVITQSLFHPEAIRTPGFTPDDAAALVDVTAREDFEACERVQQTTGSSYFEEFHTPHESLILDFRAWVHDRLYPDTEHTPAERSA
ncbi:hypothetical protein ADL22_03715 [Streptomyces sp. NRRL F-4489]|uniref:aromatic ring-hydroxylating oxygenase subunit alpha n=1 Tax=Streptomyces sp. NRRL F-4489 TaxID=1609095 RepID=UPI0007498949|nr:aromatic ring-hydroxylating dioxygenase subunit alpha [Streptomyces sp. NRRL F-4489]KUL53509.1 hypothetical protein ADL22_03715 [Streptomyces sp. NRRL F-4489]